jgi:hypothetical protein
MIACTMDMNSAYSLPLYGRIYQLDSVILFKEAIVALTSVPG